MAVGVNKRVATIRSERGRGFLDRFHQPERVRDFRLPSPCLLRRRLGSVRLDSRAENSQPVAADLGAEEVLAGFLVQPHTRAQATLDVDLRALLRVFPNRTHVVASILIHWVEGSRAGLEGRIVKLEQAAGGSKNVVFSRCFRKDGILVPLKPGSAACRHISSFLIHRTMKILAGL